jgi:hypothetical protein
MTESSSPELVGTLVTKDEVAVEDMEVVFEVVDAVPAPEDEVFDKVAPSIPVCRLSSNMSSRPTTVRGPIGGGDVPLPAIAFTVVLSCGS